MKKSDVEKYILPNLPGSELNKCFKNSTYLMIDDNAYMYFVKSTPLRAFSVSFQYFEDMIQVIADVHEEDLCCEVILTN